MAEARADARAAGYERALDVLLVVAPLAALVLLAAFVLVDPASGITHSNGPATDEAWNVVNARNLVLLGHFSTDDWNLHLVNLPFSIVEAVVFKVAGVGIGQARIVSIVAVALTMGALGVGLRRALGRGPALLAALAFGTSALVLYYGRLAFLEPTVALGLTAGALLAVRSDDARSGRFGILAGLALAAAIGTKPSAAFAAGGILLGLVVVGWSVPAVRRWLAGAVGTIGVAALLWVVAIGLPNATAVATDLRIWAAEPIIGPLTTMFHTALAFPGRNDGFVLLAAPLIAFGGVGWLLAVYLRAELGRTRTIVLGVATGWLVVGLGVLAFAPYRPNRYEVPLLPALAILGALGCSVLAQRATQWSAGRRVLLGGTLAAAVAAQGLILFGGWMVAGQHRLPDIQAHVAAIVPSGAVVQGEDAPAFALQAPVITIVSRPATRVNPGDLYASRGVRWYVGNMGTAPAWAALHPVVWSERATEFCTLWGGEHICLWHVP